MAKQGRERALGPYEHGSGWRVVYVAASGVREAGEVKSYAEACAERDVFNEAATNRTVEDAVVRYLQAKADQRGIETTRHRLAAILRLRAGGGARQLATINAPLARELYAARSTQVAADTHQGELAYVRRFFDWCVEQGWCRLNPFAEVKPVGKKRRGKPKLRVNGTRQLLALLLEDESLEATAVLTALSLGLRANEVVKRTLEDLDDDGRILWIRESKTEGSDREIEIPEYLRPRLLALAEGKRLGDRLFGDLTRYGLHYHTVRLCRLAGVNRVTPHGLRGSGATSAVRLNGGLEQVAAALGHVDGGTTAKRHYIGGGAMESARGRAIENLVNGGSYADYPGSNRAPLAQRAETPQYEGIREAYEEVN